MKREIPTIPKLEDDVQYMEELTSQQAIDVEYVASTTQENILRNRMDENSNASVKRKNEDVVMAELIKNPKCDLENPDLKIQLKKDYFQHHRRSTLLKQASTVKQKDVDKAASAAGRRAAALLEGPYENCVREIVVAVLELGDLLAHERAIRGTLTDAGYRHHHLDVLPYEAGDFRNEGSRAQAYISRAYTCGFIAISDLEQYMTKKQLSDLELTTRSNRLRLAGRAN